MKYLKPLPARGSILLPFIIIMPFLILIIAYFTSLSLTNFTLARHDQFQTNSQLGADAGADYAVGQISQDQNWNGTNGEVTLHSDSDSKTTYAVTVNNPDANTKTLTITGRTYHPTNTASAKTSVTITVDLRPVRAGSYSVVAGVGGLYMSNSSKITGGDVYVNGEVSLSNSAQIGLTTSPVNLFVANEICPTHADASYPRLCNSGENNNPISLSNTAHIYGNVQANYQTNGSAMSSPGLTASSGVAAQSLPSYNRSGQEASVATTTTGAAASCSSGTKTWAANTKITGNVSISNSCTVTVLGNIWITGNFSMSNSSQIKVDNSLGSTVPVIMVDGSGGASFGNSAALVSNSSNTGFEIITYWSTASCSPECSAVSGTDLYNSRSKTTISLSNNSQGPQTIFYARWTEVDVKNSGQIGALIGQIINMSNSGTITFGTSTGTGTTTWIISDYRRSYP